jgi:hypothetical protein
MPYIENQRGSLAFEFPTLLPEYSRRLQQMGAVNRVQVKSAFSFNRCSKLLRRLQIVLLTSSPALKPMCQVNYILERVQQGDPKAAEELLPLVYEELRRLATHRLAGERNQHTLQPTALVHEAWQRISGDTSRQPRP